MIPLVKVNLPEKSILMPKLENVLYSGQIAEGSVVYEFEKAFLSKYDYPIGIAMSSGTAALHTALLLAGVKPGDEVITTAMTAEPTNTTITEAGAKIVWADVDPTSGNLDPSSVASMVTKKTKVIVVVHYAGYPARMNEIMEVARQNGIKVIEDCAHALGARYNKRFVGQEGDFAIFSFQAIKHMTTVDGGFLVFKNDSLLEMAKRIRWFGMLKGIPRTEVDLTVQGFKYNMSNVTAQIGLLHLQSNIDHLIGQHIENGNFYDRELAKLPEIRFAKSDEFGQSSYWLYTMLVEDSERFERVLNSAGISASKLHKPNHLHSFFKSSWRDLPGLNEFYRRLIHIPCGWWITPPDREKICDVISNEAHR